MATSTLPEWINGDVVDADQMNQIRDVIQEGLLDSRTASVIMPNGVKIHSGNVDPNGTVIGNNGDLYIERNGMVTGMHVFTNTTPGTVGWSTVNLSSAYLQVFIGANEDPNTLVTTIATNDVWVDINIDPLKNETAAVRNFVTIDPNIGEIEYTGWSRPEEPRRLSGRLVIYPTGGTNDDFALRIAGSTDGGITWTTVGVPTIFRSRGAGEPLTEEIGAIVRLENGDRVKIQAKRLNGNSNLVIEFGDIQIR